mmetsp:Transcript_9728/g.16926  ORF Transcript_9728/g.16926 Transcript_9728/m.16926 type:complete len:284 (+) Transcript_9728:723-1574(+)
MSVLQCWLSVQQVRLRNHATPVVDGDAAVLDVHNGLGEATAELARLGGWVPVRQRDVVLFASVVEGLHRADDGRSPGPERLNHPLLLQSLDDLRHVVDLLGDLELAPLPTDVQDRVPRHPRQDDIPDGRRDQLRLPILVDPEEELVHGAHLSDLVIEQPQVLRVALLNSIHLGQNCPTVVRSNFEGAESSRRSSGEVFVREQLDGLEALPEVRPDGTADDVEERPSGRPNTEIFIGCNQRWPQIQRVSVLLWNPVVIHLEQPLDALDKLFGIKARQDETFCRR